MLSSDPSYFRTIPKDFLATEVRTKFDFQKGMP